MSAPARFKQEDIKRAMAGARAAGFSRVRVEIDRNGNIVVDAVENDNTPSPAATNPWDSVLPR